MKRQIVERSADDMLNAFNFKLHQLKSQQAEVETATEVEASDGKFDYDDYLQETAREIATKQVRDSDGFWTDYTLYEMLDGGYGCIFGDKDVYTPETSYWDETFDSREEAINWFDNYTGFDDEEDF